MVMRTHMREFIKGLAFCGLVALAGASNAAVIFSDNFDTENGGVEALNYSGFANWNVVNGTVDLIGNGGRFDFLPGNGLYVDMDGSTGDAGELFSSSSFLLGAGSYTLSYDLAGNQRNGATEAVTALVNLGSLLNNVVSLNRFDPFTTFTHSITVSAPTSVSLQFLGSGGDNIGMLLDNVRLETAAVPEPGLLALLGAGLLGMAAAGRRHTGKRT